MIWGHFTFWSLIVSVIDATVRLAVIVALAKYYNAGVFIVREMADPGICCLICTLVVFVSGVLM